LLSVAWRVARPVRRLMVSVRIWESGCRIRRTMLTLNSAERSTLDRYSTRSYWISIIRRRAGHLSATKTISNSWWLIPKNALPSQRKTCRGLSLQ
jgi:hypothetical protein